MWYSSTEFSLGLWQVKGWKQHPWLIHGFTERFWGNLALHVGDNPISVLARRKRLSTALNISLNSWVVANQVHKSNVAVVTLSDRGRGGGSSPAQAIPDTDALITDQPNLMLVTFYADCVPLIFLHAQSRTIAMAHAGWRGTRAKIGAAVVDYFHSIYNIHPAELEVAIGPSIGGCCYQVGNQVYSNFTSKAVSYRDSKAYLDLPLANKLQLIDWGINEDKIFVSDLCTYCDEKFFSYRREGIHAGRMGAFVHVS